MCTPEPRNQARCRRVTHPTEKQFCPDQYLISFSLYHAVTHQAAYAMWHSYSDESTRGHRSFLNPHHSSSKKREISCLPA